MDNRCWTKNIQWLFFDIGSTLIDEEAAYDHRIRDMIAGTTLVFEEVHNKRLEFAQDGLDGNSEIISYYGLMKTPWHTEDERLYPTVNSVLEYLRNRGYKLGIIANQAPGLADRLRYWGIADYFIIIASSSEMGVSKPNPMIFEKALSMAQCEPCNAVMIGDRLDNDIVPAKQFGMQTVWVRTGLASCQPKEYGAEFADMTIDSINELTDVFTE